MGSISIKPEVQQQLKIGYQLLESIHVLQMDSQELETYVERQLEENPVLEQEPPYGIAEAYKELSQKANWIDPGLHISAYAQSEGALREPGRLHHATESLPGFLKDQLERTRISGPLLTLSKYMVDLLDENGYLSQEDIDALAAAKIPEELIRQAIERLQTLEPAGVGARNLSECLVLQLKRQEPVSPISVTVAERFLPQLGKKQYAFIARELGVSVDEIRTAEQQIASLTPHPGQAFQYEEDVSVYIRPDVFVIEDEGRLEIYLNESYLPRISISSYYERMLKETDDQDTQRYLQERMQAAKALIDRLGKREKTLRRCVEAIIKTQEPFFFEETDHLVPMSITEFAKDIGFHPSTIYRAIKGKYLQCRRGIFPLSYFFNKDIGEGISDQAVKQMIAALIQGEEHRRPLSDQKLCELLEEKGVRIARRTLAKYRTQMGVSASSVRKQQYLK